MANITTNIDVDYIQRDFSSTVDAIITFANVNYGPGTSANRLWTSFNADSFSRNWLEIVAFVSDVFFFYFDNQSTQSYLQTATVLSSVKDIAKQFGFTPKSATSASGVVTVVTTGAGTISRGTIFEATNGAQFFVTQNTSIPFAGSFNLPVVQGTIVSEQFTAEGLQNEEFDLIGPNVVVDSDNLNPLDISPQITVGGNSYKLVPSFIRFNGTDTAPISDTLGNLIGGGGRVFQLDERPDGTPYIKFGDGIFGRKLNAGELITISYRSGGGSIGNIPEQTLTKVVSSSPIISSVTNSADFSGGADAQTIEQLRELIPASLRTLDRAVSEQDYSDLLVSTFSEVFAASTEANLEDPGIDLNIYVVPQGVGITKITDNILLKNKLQNYIDRRKMVTIQFQILDAYNIDALISFEVFISNTTSKSTVNNAIKAALQDFFDLSTGGVSQDGIGFATPILLKDIANLIEGIVGVERFEIKRLTYRPRVDEKIIGLITDYNVSQVQVYPKVEEREWLLAAAGLQNEVAGTVLFSNTSLIGFTYTSGTGELAYSFPVDLDGIAPGDQFRDGSGTDFTILAVDVPGYKLHLTTGLTINNTVTTSNHGSVRNGNTSYESYKVYKKILAKATNLSIDSITDNDLDLSVLTGSATAISSRVLLDNTNVFIPGEYATGAYYLVDSAGNIWDIVENGSNNIKTGLSAINDASVVVVAGGDYKIVKNLTGKQVLFQSNVFNIQYNSDNTLFSIGAQFSQIGTIGDAFAVSLIQSNKGSLGTAVDLLSFNNITKIVRLNSSPNLVGINSNNVLIDSSGQIFNIVGVDNIAKPSVFYDQINIDTQFTLQGSGIGEQIAQGFKVATTEVYAVVSLFLRRHGNIVGSLTAKIVNDDGFGLPNLGSPVAVSDPIDVSSISDITAEKILFSFATPPTLTSGTQYHLVLSSDAAYQAGEIDGVKSFDNTGLINFTYNSLSGVIGYASAVNLSSVLPGHYFSDSSGTLFQILAVDDANNEITLAASLTVDSSVPTIANDGSVFVYDKVEVGLDSSAPSYVDGEFSRFDSVSWSNSTLGPSPSGTLQVAAFSVEGTKSVIVDSNLTPVLGPGATISTRYYDDENQISLIVGLASGSITSATDVNAIGRGTVASVPNRPVDTFVFRSSRYADDVVNLRLNEIPQIDPNDIIIQTYGGVD
jgi:hypothetical protein